MKKLLIYSFAALTVLSMVMVACRKNDNPKLPALIRVPEPQFTKDATTDPVISVQNPDAFSAKFTVGLYFANDVAPKKMDIVIMKNGKRDSILLLKADVTTFPTTLTLTGAQLKAMYGYSSVLGSSYDIGANITTADGTVIPAFSPLQSAASYGSGLISQGTTGAANTPYPAAAPTINYTAICKFTMTDYGAIGSTVPFTVVKDEWNDYSAGATVPVKIIDATHMSFFYQPASNAQPIIITVDPNTNSTSVAKQIVGNYGDGYGDYSATSTPTAFDIVAPCDLTVGVSLVYSVSAGTFSGNYTIILKKK